MLIFKRMNTKGQYFRKTFFIFFSIFMALVIVISVYLISSSTKNTENQIITFENDEIGKTATKINASLYQVATVCSYLSTINFKNNYIVTPSEDYASYLISQSHIDSYSTMFNYVNQVHVRDSNGKLYRSTNAANAFPDISESNFSISGEIRNSQIFTTNKMNAFENVYFRLLNEEVPYSDNDVCVSLNTIALAKQTLNYTDKRKECIIDKNGCILSSYDASKIGYNFFEAYGIENYGVSDFTKQVKIDDVRCVVTLKKVNDTQLYAASVTDMVYYSTYFETNIYSSILICFAFLAVAIMICMIILQISYRPIKDILLQIQQYQDVNIDKNVNEINYINNKLEEMYQSNAILDKTSRQALSELKSWNIAALQAQICPHFLYNTLDSINWLAYKYLDVNNPISLAVQDTAHIMRLSLNISRMFSNIREEIEVTKKYIEIIDIRYEHRYKITWDVDSEVLDCVIPRLCIQPMIENAVNHAFTGEATENDEICISIKSAGGKIHIAVTDNGIGISPSKLAEIKKNINIDDMGNEKNVGLRNINMRCKIIYGKEYGLTIESGVNKGSSFRVTIPQDKYID